MKMEDVPVPTRLNSSSFNPLDNNDDAERYQQEQLMYRREQDRKFQDTLIYERDKEVEEIQKQMLEINEMFKYMAIEVNVQGENLTTIVDNIKVAGDNVEQGVGFVEEAEKEQEGIRNKLLWLLGCCVIMVIALVVIVVVVVYLRQPK